MLTSLTLLASITVAQLPFAVTANAVCADQPKRKTYLMGPSVGKKVAKAFELYSADDVKGALDILLEVKAKAKYDKAILANYKAGFYVSLDQYDKALPLYKEAASYDILSVNDQGRALLTIAELDMQAQNFQSAIDGYYAWMDFTCDSDDKVWTKIASGHYSLKQYAKILKPADKAIAAAGDKLNILPYTLKFSSFYERKMNNEAIDVLETIVQTFPENKQWWIVLGQLYTVVEKFEKGLQTLELANKLGYLEKESQITTLASLYHQRGIPYQSALLMEKYIASGVVKRDDKNLKSLAGYWHASLNLDKAAKYYGELAKMTNDIKYYEKQGFILEEAEQYKKAIVVLNKALKLGAKKKGKIYMSIAMSNYYLEEFKKSYDAILKAAKDPKTRKYANQWKTIIADKAKRKGKSV